MKARLVPLSTMIPRLYRTARAVALKQHKEFEFVLEGQETEVDRTVIEEIAGPLLHLMRNAVNHAIETPGVRLQKGKSPAGQIKLSAAYEGNQVVITVRDDGTFRREALHVLRFLPHEALGDEEGEVGVDVPGFLEHAVKDEPHLLPYSVAVGSDDHGALDRCVVRQLCAENNVNVPLREIFSPRRDA